MMDSKLTKNCAESKQQDKQQGTRFEMILVLSVLYKVENRNDAFQIDKILCGE